MTISIEDLARQVQVLRDIEEIKKLKHAYFRCIDTANLEELKTLMHPEVTTVYIGGSYRIELKNRDEFIEMIASSFHSECVARHNGHHPEIDILSETEATAKWYLHDDFRNYRLMVRTEGTAIYVDRYVKVDGRWLFKHKSYERIYERIERIQKVPKYTTNTLAVKGRRLPKEEQAK
ncbi:MAG TPA: nuclear transport factor 2 family protein [Steroidobacteraceae bacterium]|nr:nuclear transport factor 2 family protein [Steroidobacteraceae bacterium]